MTVPLNLLLVDRTHLDDLLFARDLGRRLATRPTGALPMLLVHGSGDRSERLLESSGFDVRRREDRLMAESPAEAAVIERGMRETTQRLVAGLTDQGAAAVGLHGCDRGTLVCDPRGALSANLPVIWHDMARAGAVPVVSALAREASGAVVEQPPGAVLAAVGRTLAQTQPVRVLLLTGTRTAGLVQNGVVRASISDIADADSQSSGHLLPVIERLAPEAFEVWLTHLAGLKEPPVGTRLAHK